jgi:hypothetical protein
MREVQMCMNLDIRHMDQMVTDIIDMASNIVSCFKQYSVGHYGAQHKQSLDIFFSAFSNFMVAQAEARISLMSNMHNETALEALWEEVQHVYAAVPNKPSHVIDLWKTMSAKVSQLLYVKQLG